VASTRCSCGGRCSSRMAIPASTAAVAWVSLDERDDDPQWGCASRSGPVQ
jgi:hypothetical protein